MISIAIRPGVVDTDMQTELREIHGSKMQGKDLAKFVNLHKDGALLKPEQPGHVMAKLILGGPRELSGECLT